jgi:hypothetical protein
MIYSDEQAAQFVGGGDLTLYLLRILLVLLECRLLILERSDQYVIIDQGRKPNNTGRILAWFQAVWSVGEVGLRINLNV